MSSYRDARSIFSNGQYLIPEHKFQFDVMSQCQPSENKSLKDLHIPGKNLDIIIMFGQGQKFHKNVWKQPLHLLICVSTKNWF